MQALIAAAWGLAAMLAGGCIALQAPINAELGRALGQPLAAAAISFVAGAVFLTLIAAGVSRAGGHAIAWSMPPLWMFVAGGVLGTAYVTCAIFLVPRIGAAALMAFAVTGQLVAGLLIDRAGLLGIVAREISLGRVAGVAMLLGGALLVRLT